MKLHTFMNYLHIRFQMLSPTYALVIVIRLEDKYRFHAARHFTYILKENFHFNHFVFLKDLLLYVILELSL
jgi:hypothetical protein